MIKRYKFITLLFYLFGVFFLSSCGETDDAPVPAPLREVRTMIVETGSGVIERNFSGTLKSSNETSYSFKVSGTIDNIAVQVGQAVKRGDVIAVMDPSDYELEVQKTNASLIEAQSALRNAEADYERTKKLYEAGNSSRADLDNARASAETAAASTQAMRKSLQIAQQNLSYTRLRAQDNCQIASTPANAGENVSSGTEVITASCGDDLEVDLDIPESVIGFIKKDMGVTINFAAIPNKTYEGIVKEVGVATVSGGTTFPVTILMTESDTKNLKSGLSATVNFSINNQQAGKETLPLLPAFAVGEDQNGRFVFLVEPGDTGTAIVKRIPVAIGAIHNEGIEIKSGIQPGMQVVTAGVSVLRDGMEVRVSQ